MKLFRLEDGAVHWIFAKSKEQAIGLWLQNALQGGSSFEEATKEKPGVEEMAGTQTFAYTMSSGKVFQADVSDWTSIISSPVYFACSEY